MNLKELSKDLEQIIAAESQGFKAETAFVLGSGLSALADDLQNKKVIPYSVLPGFGSCTVKGHNGNFVIGLLNDTPVLFLQGRPHWYEDKSAIDFHVFILAIKAFGCKKILMTNAAGAIDSNIPVGAIVGITDHINLQFRNPLIGVDTAEDRFLGLDQAYDEDLRAKLQQAATSIGMDFYEGVYVSTLGPSFETPAEIRAYRILGGHVVGMSTVPEVITARYYGLKVAVLSVISNKAAGMSDEFLSHELTLARAMAASDNLKNLIKTYVKKCK
jgi:xanthosine phosphorylase